MSLNSEDECTHVLRFYVAELLTWQKACQTFMNRNTIGIIRKLKIRLILRNRRIFRFLTYPTLVGIRADGLIRTVLMDL